MTYQAIAFTPGTGNVGLYGGGTTSMGDSRITTPASITVPANFQRDVDHHRPSSAGLTFATRNENGPGTAPGPLSILSGRREELDALGGSGDGEQIRRWSRGSG